MKISLYTIIKYVLVLILAVVCFYQHQEIKNLHTKLDIVPTVSVDTNEKPADASQPLITEVKVVDTTQKEIAVTERPVDPNTNIKDPAFLDLTDSNKVYARINNNDKLIELPTTLTTETKIGDTQVKIREQNSTFLDIRAPKREADLGIGRTFPKHGDRGYSFGYAQPIMGHSGVMLDVRYDTDDGKKVLMLRFPLSK